MPPCEGRATLPRVERDLADMLVGAALGVRDGPAVLPDDAVVDEQGASR